MQIAVLLLLFLSSQLVADGYNTLKVTYSQRWPQIHGTSLRSSSSSVGSSIAAVASSGGIVESCRPSRIDSSVMNSADAVCEWDLPSVTAAAAAATSDMAISKEIMELLVHANASVSHLKFSRSLKHVASQRLSLSGYDRFLLVQSVVRYLGPMDRSSLSHCVWALGVLGVDVGDFSPTHGLQQSSSLGFNESRRPRSPKIHLEYPNLISLVKKVDECYSSVVDGEHSSSSSSSEVVDLLRTTSGLSKLGLRWVDVSPSLQRRFLRLTFDLGQPLSGRELASALYVLGQLDVDKTALSAAYVQSLLGCLWKDETLDSLTPQGLTNAMHGLSRMGFQWSDLLVFNHGSGGSDDNEAPLQLKLLRRSELLLPLARTDELCSYLNSLAVMQFHLPSSCRDPSAGDLPLRSVLVECLSSKLNSFSRRELVNVVWALGQIDFTCSAATAAGTALVAPSISPSSSSSSFSEWDGLLGPLLDRVESAVLVTPTMTAFDMESLLVGMELLQVRYCSLSVGFREQLVASLTRQLPSMNIFALRQVLVGLARMRFSVGSLGSELSTLLLDRLLSSLEAFLPEQVGDVLLSASSLGYCKAYLSRADSARLIDSLRRVFLRLPVRDAALVLKGLSAMGYKWHDDLRAVVRINGRIIDAPLSDTIVKYLRQRVASMREYEYSVVLQSLGRLGVHWHSSLPQYVTQKIDHRLTRVGKFFSPSSLVDTISGLSSMQLLWTQLSPSGRQSLEEALVDRGFQAMSSDELISSMRSLDAMKLHMDGTVAQALLSAMRSPSSEENNMRSPSSEENNMRSPSSEENNMRSPSLEENNMRSPSSEENNMRSPSSKENDVTSQQLISDLESNMR